MPSCSAGLVVVVVDASCLVCSQSRTRVASISAHAESSLLCPSCSSQLCPSPALTAPLPLQASESISARCSPLQRRCPVEPKAQSLHLCRQPSHDEIISSCRRLLLIPPSADRPASSLLLTMKPVLNPCDLLQGRTKENKKGTGSARVEDED
ncbi:hypothetical protein M0R45_008961 [Rubus argutus]|uniref:Uncharacterized protein n=1 Tax=Rubus argutus TaxID=59490 RepID=A0AAW1Y277_RUBAR